MKINKIISRVDIPLPIVTDKVIDQLEDIKSTLIKISRGDIALESGKSVVLDSETSEVDGFCDQTRFRRVCEFIMTTKRELKLTNLSYQIKEDRRIIYITKQ